MMIVLNTKWLFRRIKMYIIPCYNLPLFLQINIFILINFTGGSRMFARRMRTSLLPSASLLSLHFLGPSVVRSRPVCSDFPSPPVFPSLPLIQVWGRCKLLQLVWTEPGRQTIWCIMVLNLEHLEP